MYSVHVHISTAYTTCRPISHSPSLGPRPSPLRDLVRAFNCAGEGNIENGEGLYIAPPGMKHHVPIDAPGRARPVASTANMYTLASVRLLSFC